MMLHHLLGSLHTLQERIHTLLGGLLQPGGEYPQCLAPLHHILGLIFTQKHAGEAVPPGMGGTLLQLWSHPLKPAPRLTMGQRSSYHLQRILRRPLPQYRHTSDILQPLASPHTALASARSLPAGDVTQTHQRSPRTGMPSPTHIIPAPRIVCCSCCCVLLLSG